MNRRAGHIEERSRIAQRGWSSFEDVAPRYLAAVAVQIATTARGPSERASPAQRLLRSLTSFIAGSTHGACSIIQDHGQSVGHGVEPCWAPRSGLGPTEAALETRCLCAELIASPWDKEESTPLGRRVGLFGYFRLWGGDPPRFDERGEVGRRDRIAFRIRMWGSAPSAHSPYTVAVQSPSCWAASRTDSSPSLPPRRTSSRAAVAGDPGNNRVTNGERTGATVRDSWERDAPSVVIFSPTCNPVPPPATPCSGRPGCFPS